MNSKLKWKRVMWGALCLVVLGAVIALFFLPPGFGNWSISEFLHAAPTTSVTFSPDGKRLAMGRLEGDVQVWEVATGQLRQTLRGPEVAEVTGVAFSPTGELLAAGSANGTVRVWEVPTGQPRQTLQVPKAEKVTGVAFSPTG